MSCLCPPAMLKARRNQVELWSRLVDECGKPGLIVTLSISEQKHPLLRHG